MEIGDKDQLNCWMQKALESHKGCSYTDDSFIELYNIQLRLKWNSEIFNISDGINYFPICQLSEVLSFYPLSSGYF